MSDQLFWGDALDEVGTTQLHELGTERVEHNNTYGERVWRYVKNAEAATAFAAGTVVMNKTTTTEAGQTLVCATSTSVHRVVGVAQHAIAAGSYGWILRRGVGSVVADTGGVTADTGLVPGNAVAGTADNVGGATAVAFALCLETKAATESARCLIFCA